MTAQMAQHCPVCRLAERIVLTHTTAPWTREQIRRAMLLLHPDRRCPCLRHNTNFTSESEGFDICLALWRSSRQGSTAATAGPQASPCLWRPAAASRDRATPLRPQAPPPPPPAPRPQRLEPTVHVFSYDENLWVQVFRGNTVYAGRIHRRYLTDLDVDRLALVSQAYLQQPWIWDRSLAAWRVKSDPTPVLRALMELGLQVLPWWAETVMPLSRKFRKELSYDGEVRGRGDMGNKVYALAVRMALRMNTRRLWSIEQLNEESAGDIVEGILTLGARDLAWEHHRAAVELICIEVDSAWNLPQHRHLTRLDEVLDRLTEHFGVYAWLDDEKVFERQRRRQELMTSLMLAFPLHVLPQSIVKYLFTFCFIAGVCCSRGQR